MLLMNKMKPRIFVTMLALFIPLSSSAQALKQFFDGRDTLAERALLIKKDTGSFWQIGPPQKSIFNEASTPPNALMTDTSNTYPSSDTGRFKFGINLKRFHRPGSRAPVKLMWVQQIDIDKGDLGTIEFSVDTGKTWMSPFDNINVENFYGFEKKNIDTLKDGTLGFNKVDSNWKDIWLCFKREWINQHDSLIFRFTFFSNGTQSNREGWMIDDMVFERTAVHTVGEDAKAPYLEVFPSPTEGKLEFRLKKRRNLQKITTIKILNTKGLLVKQLSPSNIHFTTNLQENPPGLYYIKIYTTDQIETHPFILK